MIVKGRRVAAFISVIQILSGRGGGFQVAEREKKTALCDTVTITSQSDLERMLESEPGRTTQSQKTLPKPSLILWLYET